MVNRFYAAVVLVFSLSGPLLAQTVKHPLDPLSWQEYWSVLEVLRDAEHLDHETRFSIIQLQEPQKNVVLSWVSGQTIPRSAYAVVRQGSESYEAVVNLVDRRLDVWKKLEGVQPSWLDEEFHAVSDVVKQHPKFVEAMKKRGINDLTFLDVHAIPPGYFGTEEEVGRRIAHCRCVDVRRNKNLWPRHIAGLTVVVDMLEMKVLRVVDEGAVPVPDVNADYDQSSIGEPRKVPGPIRMTRPLGPGFRLDGNQVEWQKWSFHVRPDQRVGMIISQVAYRDGDESRRVLYQGHLSEMFVPYMDPSFSWYPRNFIDAGEFPAGGLAKPLLPGLDCPSDAAFLNAVIGTDTGRPKSVQKTIAIFERYAGDIAWRHWNDEPTSRPKRDLVVRNAVVIGNYDYVIDWIFQQNGSIQVAVGSTGIVEVKAVKSRSTHNRVKASARDFQASDGSLEAVPHSTADEYGRFVDKHIVAVNHDHYFSFRLDLDVDGQENTLILDRLRTRLLPENHPRRSIWVREPFVAKTESEAKLNINLDSPALWRVTSQSRRNHVGYPTSYQIMPMKNGKTLLSPDDFPRRRAGFIEHHLWVTPYRVDERYAAGEFPTLSEPGQGLPKWTAADRSIESTDIVVWYTIGMHHFVRAEDWPVMPVMWQSFELRPFDFFDRNPALDLPQEP